MGAYSSKHRGLPTPGSPLLALDSNGELLVEGGIGKVHVFLIHPLLGQLNGLAEITNLSDCLGGLGNKGFDGSHLNC